MAAAYGNVLRLLPFMAPRCLGLSQALREGRGVLSPARVLRTQNLRQAAVSRNGEVTPGAGLGAVLGANANDESRI